MKSDSWKTPAGPSRWIAAITRVLREDLDLHPHVSRVAMLTATSEQARDFDVMVHVLRCEGGRDGDVARFRVRLEILSPDANNQIRAGEVFSTEIPGWNGKDYRPAGAEAERGGRGPLRAHCCDRRHRTCGSGPDEATRING